MKTVRLLVGIAALISVFAGTAVVGVAPASGVRTYLTVIYGNSYPELGITYFTSEGADVVSVEVESGDNGRIIFRDPNAAAMSLIDDQPGTACTLDDAVTISCAKSVVDGNNPPSLRRVHNVSVVSWGGDDVIASAGFGMVMGSTYTPITVTLSGWEDADTLTATGGRSRLIGGTGDDRLVSGPGTPNFRDSLDGGEGNDTIDSVTGSPDLDGVYCRTGTDHVVKDTGDILYDTASCESVTTP
ncbi:hypothetical protein [Kribbella deserti]|uniref:Calcium-binding protein n=1 Tax=Kribbella deserti TaxID=1926257 RepID=A0ABV6QPS6_9ACTN